ncbi:CRISPR-associated endonuclease Cas1 [Alkalinema pantanalense CENA528]|uniref:CRISPR-associated endonuclease Cas1 n=1 Tax=Alkalinema pantanalense TaxID=1620705 RepID=UPI003D6FCB39
MRSLYLSQQGCSVSLEQEALVVRWRQEELQRVQLPLVEQVLVFGQSQLTTQAIRACLQRDIPIAYLSRLGFCYGRTIAIARGYRQLARFQQELSQVDRLAVAQRIVQGKLKNCRTLLLRQARRRSELELGGAIERLQGLAEQTLRVDGVERLLGIEGAGAAVYFEAFGRCLQNGGFVFGGRSRRPPGDAVNAMLSFGYQVVWNHVLTLVELQGLDPYGGCLHSGSARHAALVSDLVEEFRGPIVDSLVLYLVNRRMVDAVEDFEFRDGGCFLNVSGRRKFLRAFLERMEEVVGDQPRWDLLNRQVKRFKQFVYQPVYLYEPYLIR